MEKQKIAKLVTIISALLSIMAAVAKNLSDVDKFHTTILIYIFAGIFIVCLVLIGVFYIIDFVHEKRGKPSASVEKTASLYIKQLYKLSKEIDKKLNRTFVYNVSKAYRRERKYIIDAEKREKEEKRDDEKRAKQRKPNFLMRLFRNKYYTVVRYEVISFSDFVIMDAKNENNVNRFFLEAQTLCKEILSLSRTLIQINQNDMRIKLGKFVVKYSNDEMDTIKAYIDLIGFTNILDGNFKQAKEAIDIADKLIEKRMKKELSDKDYADCIMQEARSLRHLSTTYYTYDKNKQNLQTIKDGYEILNNEKLKKFYKLAKPIKNDKVTLEYESDYYRMIFGYDTNEILHLLYDYYYAHKKDLINNAYEKLSLIDKDLAMLDLMKENGMQFDKHRYMKLEALKLQIVRILKMNGNKELKGKDGVIDLEKIDIEKSFKNIEDIIHDNIYFDDALEMYTNEKIHYCFKEVDKTINNK